MSGGIIGVKGAVSDESRLAAVRLLRKGGRFCALGSSVVLLGMLPTGRGAAQVAEAGRLSVRPHEVKGAERNGQAGDIPLDSLPGYSLYVPEACTGKRRCPLVLVVSDLPPLVNGMPQTALGWLRPIADKYGLLMLVLEPYLPVRPMDASLHQSGGKDLGLDTRRLDAALARVLQQSAVDPDRIALLGSWSFPNAPPPEVLRNVWPWAVQNLDVFSRVVMSGIPLAALPVPAPAVPARLTRFLLATEAFRLTRDTIPFGFAKVLRRQGYPAELLLSLKTSGRGLWEELDFVGRWLQDSWTISDTAARPTTRAATLDSPLLTTAALGQLAQFWTSFQQEPDSIRRVGRRAHLREVVLPVGVGVERPVTWLTDMAALAAQYPSVAAKLKAAGLTGQQHDAYRLALIDAHFARAFGSSSAGVAADPVLAQNLAFLEAHAAEAYNPEGLRLTATNWLVSGMWQVP